MAADSKKQSSDRYVVEIFYARVKQWYVVEIFYARVKQWLILQDTARWSKCAMLDDAWHIAVASTDCNAFLRKPNNLEEMEVKMGNLRDSTRAAVLRLASEWPAGCGAIPSYLQLQQ